MGGDVLNISPLMVWVVVGSQLLTFGLTVWNLVSSASRANAKRLEEHAEILRKLEGRVGGVEMAHRDMPKQKDFHELEVTMTELKGALGILTERLRPLEAISERAQEWMMEHGGRG